MKYNRPMTGSTIRHIMSTYWPVNKHLIIIIITIHQRKRKDRDKYNDDDDDDERINETGPFLKE